MKFSSAQGRNLLRERQRRDRATSQPLRVSYPQFASLKLQFEFREQNPEIVAPVPHLLFMHPPSHAYFLFPSYIDRSYVINVAPIDSLRRKLAGGMNIPILGTPKDFVMNKQYFFDTRYHLNRQGRYLRTLKMIEVLRDAGLRDGWLH